VLESNFYFGLALYWNEILFSGSFLDWKMLTSLCQVLVKSSSSTLANVLAVLCFSHEDNDGCTITGMPADKSFRSSIAPWLSVRKSAEAVEFYKSAFGATEAYRLEAGDGVVSRLAIQGSEFWVSDESPEHGNFSPETLNGGSVRMILTVEDPDAAFARDCSAGATEVYPVGEEYGWRVGRVVDPFGHHWEIGRELT
jgi:PhnB protein